MALQSKLIVVFIFLICGFSCGEKPTSNYTHTAVIVDITASSKEALPSGPSIVENIRKKTGNINDVHRVSFTFLDDMSGSPFKEFSIEGPQGGAMMENPKKRQRLVDTYFDEMTSSITELIAKEDNDKASSKIYAKLCRSLDFLAKSEANIKQMYIYSDMLENSELANFYKSSELDKFSTDPKSVYNQILAQVCTLPDLTGITIFINPYRTPETDTSVNKAEVFWKSLFESLGAEVKIDEL